VQKQPGSLIPTQWHREEFEGLQESPLLKLYALNPIKKQNPRTFGQLYFQVGQSLRLVPALPRRAPHCRQPRDDVALLGDE
jgi:hypothetical protein